MKQLTNWLLSKRFLYILCFMTLCLIDMLRTTQPGNIWSTANNCTGLVMMVIIVSAYPLKAFLNRFSLIFTCVCGAAMVGVHFYWQNHIGSVIWGQYQTAVLNIWWMGIVAWHLFQKHRKERSLNLKPDMMGWLWIGLTVLMLISNGRSPWQLWFFLMFGMFYLTRYPKEDLEALVEGMITGTIVSFFCMQIYAYGFRPFDAERYVGAYSNANMMALFYLIVYAMCLFKLHLLELRNAHKGWKLFYLIGAGGLLSFQIFTMGRTAWVTSVVITLLYGILVVRRLWQKRWSQVIGRGFALVMAVALTFLPVFYTIRWLPTILHYPVWYFDEYSPEKVHSFDPADSWKYMELEEVVGKFVKRIINTFSGIDTEALEEDENTSIVNQPESMEIQKNDGTVVDKGLTERSDIYQLYAKNLNWTGHRAEDGLVRDDGTISPTWHAHNLWLEVAFLYGIPAGILLIVITLAILYGKGKLLRKEDNTYGLIPFFICVIVFVFGLMEMVWFVGQLSLVLFFFVQHPQIGEYQNEKNTDNRAE